MVGTEHKQKATLFGLAAFVFGLAMTALQVQSVYVAGILFAVTAVLIFFGVIIETPKKALPIDLQKLKSDIEGMGGNLDIIKLITSHQKEIEKFISALTHEAEKRKLSISEVVSQFFDNFTSAEAETKDTAKKGKE